MSKSDAWENALLLLLFNNTNAANIGDATGLRGSSAAGSLYISLHTADPGDAGDQTTSECNYTGYARQAAARSSGGFTVSANSVSPAANATFPNPTNATNLPQTATHFGIGTASSGAGVLLYSGALNPTIVISNTGVTPIVGTGTTVTED
jgi:phospholipase C